MVGPSLDIEREAYKRGMNSSRARHTPINFYEPLDFAEFLFSVYDDVHFLRGSPVAPIHKLLYVLARARIHIYV